MESAERIDQADELGLSAYYAASAQYLYGNCSKALRLANQAEGMFRGEAYDDWADRAKFLCGKLLFEIGHYQDALAVFESLESASFQPNPKHITISAWVYRSKLYLQSPLSPKPDFDEGDVKLFEMEAAYLSRDYRKTCTLADKLLKAASVDMDDFLFTEQPDWSSGFAQCEFFTISRSEMTRRSASAYRALALSKLPNKEDDFEEARNELQALMREDPLMIDPHDAFYCYAFYRALQENRGHQNDMNTAVSLAFKRLHKRAGRIDDTEIKKDFLFIHYWNSALSAVAKEYKLI
jgi:tetratricopeptide (TPR) repeat protein